MDNYTELHMPRIKEIEQEIQSLNNEIKSVMSNATPSQIAYYNVQQALKKFNFRLDLSTITTGYKYVIKGESYSCSVDTMVRYCKGDIKVLIDNGY